MHVANCLSFYLCFSPARLLYQDTRPWELTLQQRFRVCFLFSCIAISLPFGCRVVFECGDSFLLSVGHESKDADMRYVNSRVQGAFLDMLSEGLGNKMVLEWPSAKNAFSENLKYLRPLNTCNLAP
jgi:hypothetical protein